MVTLGNGTLTTGDATPLTEFAGVISGSGGLTKQGTGIFRLSGVNTYTGPTTINDGTLELAINDALEALATADSDSADLVKLRFFAGFTLEEIAEAQDVSIRTITRNWAYARAWLAKHLKEED